MTNFQFLEKGRILSFPHGAEISVLMGAVWITLEGDSQDYVIEAGQKFTGSSEGLLVVEALENSTVVVSPADFNKQLPQSNQDLEKPVFAAAQ